MESVEDEWDRELDATEALDELYIDYDADRVTVDKLLATVQEHQFEAIIKE